MSCRSARNPFFCCFVCIICPIEYHWVLAVSCTVGRWAHLQLQDACSAWLTQVHTVPARSTSGRARAHEVRAPPRVVLFIRPRLSKVTFKFQMYEVIFHKRGQTCSINTSHYANHFHSGKLALRATTVLPKLDQMCHWGQSCRLHKVKCLSGFEPATNNS